jgi:hypothetical protein
VVREELERLMRWEERHRRLVSAWRSRGSFSAFFVGGDLT